MHAAKGSLAPATAVARTIEGTKSPHCYWQPTATVISNPGCCLQPRFERKSLRSRFRLAADVRELSAFVRICPRSKALRRLVRDLMSAGL